MPQISLDCPYCGTKKVSFNGTAYFPFEPGGTTTNKFLVLMQCQICRDCIVAKFEGEVNVFTPWIQGSRTLEVGGIKLIEAFPKPVAALAPQHTPENVSRFYSQGMDNLARNFDAAGTMFRKSLDTALKHLDPIGKGTLETRINKLPQATGVTPAMQMWAHEIRHLGNDAAHEEDPFSETEAKSLQSFTELFLTYVFTLPGMVAARKASPPSVP